MISIHGPGALVRGRPLQGVERLRRLSQHRVSCIPTYGPLVRILLLPLASFVSLDVLLGIQIKGGLS